ncbi:hypothetical protein [Amycolatopsis sp. NPDC021455]|uniref:hypothetical protein n=1 Tax=Amycolatopsis sp. NPDC021455 TaxID=3154901 RepID=UPI0033DCD925
MSEDERQHPSHQGLLTHPDGNSALRAKLDAIIVPNGRTSPYLRQAIDAARQLDAHLLLLCSLRADATRAAAYASRAGVRVTAIDVRGLAEWGIFKFDTDRLLQSTRFRRNVDTSLKRNLGLSVAALTGWRRILFLDDDIVLPDLDDLEAAAGMLGQHSVVGLRNGGMPDNSVVCHALRDVGVAQATFIGGGALVVGEAAFDSFFPNIYNEDWFFLLDGVGLRRSAAMGLAIQQPYDPYRDARRARGEELGDTLAEGVFGLLDSGFALSDADEKYWSAFLPSRRRIIRRTIERVESSAIEPAQKERMIVALKAAIGRSHLITPELCVGYLRAWQDDSDRWRDDMLGSRRDGSSVDAALESLGIDHTRVHRGAAIGV